jgi:hypothetical protein
MTRRFRHTRHIAVLVAATLATGCGSLESTRRAPVTDQLSGTIFSVYTHCGLESARIDGRWWHAKPPLYNQERTGPPRGWGNPYQEGTLTRESADSAVFEALGQRVILVPDPDNEPVRVCR